MKKESIILEIRASEGGSDSKLIVEDMMNIYLKSARINNFESKVLERRDGYASICFVGKGSKSYYGNEGGGHRWIRTPPTEKRGRTQTSIVTVSVMEDIQFESIFNINDVDKKYIRSSGNGGQRINKVATCVQLTHLPTGIQVKCQDTRYQRKNEEIAFERLSRKISNLQKIGFDKEIRNSRFLQAGDSNRSNRRRSYRVNDNVVIDHLSNKSCPYKDFIRGKINLLF